MLLLSGFVRRFRVEFAVEFRRIFHEKIATMASGSRVKPVVVILGSTGTGKTKLSIELARRFDGEIISADSMQVYRGLDIVTAKATREEQSQAPHHLLDVATPDQAFTVIHFREQALPIIDRMLNENRLPVVVGGTNYYIESLLWQVLIGSGIREERGRRRRVVNQSDPKRAKFAINNKDEKDDDDVDDRNQQQQDVPAGSSLSRCVQGHDDGDNEAAREAAADANESESGTTAAEANDERETTRKKVRVLDKSEGELTVAGEEAAEAGRSGVGKFEEGNEEDFAAAAASADVDKVLLMTTEQMEQLESSLLHRVLRQVDPVTADRLHPNNKRKIVRALEVLRHDKKPLSRLLDEQRSQEGGSNLGGPLRYRNVVIFWLRCEQETLNARLDARVDSMVAQGLLEEIRRFYEQYVEPFEDNDFHRGILQSIGFKEFATYLSQYGRDQDRLITEFMQSTGPNQRTDPPEGLALLHKCLDNLKLVTRRYSKKQIKWINHRFLSNSQREVPPMYALDTTDVSRWEELVSCPAQEIIEATLAGRSPTTQQPLPKQANPREGLNEETSFHCDICRRTIVGEYQWRLHMRSNKHKRSLHGHHKKAAGRLDPAK
ncbi:tRNA dimethylallyltransferase [Wyeomyia smithii]|uniref:tRNA dimethylallyltransferase n=1 Tax=Wyeomyia smithii TaxID=174621 RepID=UPI002468165C|nr:tRNA dimethylallyltransferase [Wyeomyia smithii]